MAKHKLLSPGSKYIKELGLSPASNWRVLERQLVSATDKKTANRFLKMMDQRADGKGDNIGFYTEKNKTLELSLAITGSFDANIIKKACDWVYSNRQYFGGTILEVGCDCGVMSCFLGRLFPESRIIAIDRCKKAIENANELAAKLGVSNVEFLACDLKDVEGTYDTVFSMRTMHENDKSKEDPLNELEEQAQIFERGLSPYAKMLESKMKADGVLLSFERIGRNALLLGWMKALYNAGVLFNVDTYKEIACIEIGEVSSFTALVSFHKPDALNVGPDELFHYACEQYLDYSKPSYMGWDAAIVFADRKGKLIEGYWVKNKRPHMNIKISVWTHKYDPTGLILYQNNDGVRQLTFHDISSKEEVLNEIHGAIKESKTYGATIKNL